VRTKELQVAQPQGVWRTALFEKLTPPQCLHCTALLSAASATRDHKSSARGVERGGSSLSLSCTVPSHIGCVCTLLVGVMAAPYRASAGAQSPVGCARKRKRTKQS
jgi:hypothetical protein